MRQACNTHTWIATGLTTFMPFKVLAMTSLREGAAFAAIHVLVRMAHPTNESPAA